MADDPALVEKREEIKKRHAEGAYPMQLLKWVDRTGQLIQRIFRTADPPSYWLSASVLVMIPVLIDVGMSLFLGEFQKSSRRELIPLELATAGLLLVMLVAGKLTFDLLSTTMHKHLLDSITSMKDLTDIHHWGKSLSSNKALFFGLCFSIFMVGVNAYFISIPKLGFISPGWVLFVFIIMGGLGMGLYHLLQVLHWEIRLGRYQLNLYPMDPRNSEVIDRLSSMHRSSLYLYALVGIAMTVLFTGFGLTTTFWIILLIITMWSPVISFFIIGQVSLSNIITNAKWQKLNQIQARIEKLVVEGNIEDKDTLETIKRLIEFHNQILGTPNSALNFRSGLNFINSLMLPLIAFVLGNLDLVLGLFSDKP